MKQHYCFLERFNNYFNRKIIKYESLSDYVDHASNSFIPYNEDGSMTPFDFNPNDNVMTEIIANNIPFDPDYFLLLDDDGKIAQRWYVLEQKRNRQGQWLYQLRRDVIADNFNSLLKAPIFVEKGMLGEEDPFIVNDEGMNVNQIKKREIKLYDRSRTAWIVGYISKNSNINVSVGSVSIDIDHKTLSEIASDMGIAEADLLNQINFGSDTTKKTFFTTGSVEMILYLMEDPSSPIDHYYYYRFLFDNDFSSNLSAYRDNYYDIFPHSYLFRKYGTLNSNQLDNFKTYFKNAVISNRSNWISGIPSLLGRDHYFTENQLAILNKYNGALIKYNNTYYKLNINGTGTNTNRKYDITYDGTNVALGSTISSTISNASSDYTLVSGSGYKLFELTVNDQEYVISMQEASVEDEVPQITTTVSSGRKPTEDQVYDIFAIPLDIEIYDGTNFVTSDKFSRIVASEIAKQGDSVLYDLQLLPYCPLPDMLVKVNYINITSLTENADFDYIYYNAGDDPVKCGIIFYIPSSNFKTTIEEEIKLNKSKKVISNCYLWRLCSPNYQGIFDFNIAKNGGSVPYFNVFCSYKPYTPIIKVAPAFNWLYGMEYEDNRGLICGGDYSLPRVSDAWVQYQLNNKNYQNIFNREIQHLDFMQSLEMRNQIVSGAVGILADTTKGAGAGAMAGGPYGAIAGAVVGGTASAIGYGIDVDTMARTHRENKQLAIDKFNYQLGNIKALPYTLTKVGSFDIISKIIPFVEEYSCSDEELEAFENKIKYESMTVMRIGTLDQYINYNSSLNYFKGSLIRNDEIAEDNHMLNAIYEELLKGVYL